MPALFYSIKLFYFCKCFYIVETTLSCYAEIWDDDIKMKTKKKNS